MVESLTDKVMRRININGERIRRTVETVLPIDHLPDLLEAAALEKGVFIELNKSEGENNQLTQGKETVSGIVPEGHTQVRIHSTRPSLDTFWNTFDALREYDRPIPQS